MCNNCDGHRYDHAVGDVDEAEGAGGARAGDERAIHDRLLGGDPVAPSLLVETYLPRLVGALGRAYPGVDPHLIETAATDAVLNLAKAPRRFDPSRGPLFPYLRMDAVGDLRNSLQAARRDAARRASLEAVELHPRPRNQQREDRDDPLERLIRRADGALLADLCAGFEPREREVIDLMADGERRTPVFAKVLDLGQLPPEEQARAVKRGKDRLLKRLRRRAERRGLGRD
jgi:hypothetical protein